MIGLFLLIYFLVFQLTIIMYTTTTPSKSSTDSLTTIPYETNLSFAEIFLYFNVYHSQEIQCVLTLVPPLNLC